MKRLTALTALLLGLMLVCVCAAPWGLPGGRAEKAPAECADGSVLAVENRSFTSRIYTVKDGQIRGIYEESRLRASRESRIARAAAGDGTYFLRTYSDAADWELVRLTESGAQTLLRAAAAAPMTFTGLRFEDGVMWITAVGADGSVSVYRWTAADGAALEMVLSEQWLEGIETAEYDGAAVRVTTRYGDGAFLSADGTVRYSADAAQAEGPVLSAAGTGWLLCKRTALAAALLLWLLLAADILTAGVICRRAERLTVKLTAVTGAALLSVLPAAEAAVFLSMSGDPVQAWATARHLAVLLAAVWLCAMALVRGVTGYVTAPLKKMAAQMERMADGDTEAREPVGGQDELSRLDRSLQMLSMSLSVWDYESVCTIRSYSRFVPERMAELLGRPVVEEIRLGDNRRMSGNVGIFSVGNRAEARNALSDTDFVSFINHSFGIFHDSITENNGCAVSSGLRLSAMEALFPDAAADGVRAGLDFLGRLCPRDGDEIPTPRAAVLLHKASFLYGIAGKEERLFPYLSSSELDYLGTLLPEFDRAGVHIVATEAYWKQLEGCGFTGRYIGFVSGGERLGSYKLYELLDAYPQRKRELQKGYDARFQEAINLFYRNDFYLARNLFSTLLRACPDDGIARWYLFACEHFFDQGGMTEADYRLFGQKT